MGMLYFILVWGSNAIVALCESSCNCSILSLKKYYKQQAVLENLRVTVTRLNMWDRILQ